MKRVRTDRFTTFPRPNEKCQDNQNCVRVLNILIHIFENNGLYDLDTDSDKDLIQFGKDLFQFKEMRTQLNEAEIKNNAQMYFTGPLEDLNVMFFGYKKHRSNTSAIKTEVRYPWSSSHNIVDNEEHYMIYFLAARFLNKRVRIGRGVNHAFNYILPQMKLEKKIDVDIVQFPYFLNIFSQCTKKNTPDNSSNQDVWSVDLSTNSSQFDQYKTETEQLFQKIIEYFENRKNKHLSSTKKHEFLILNITQIIRVGKKIDLHNNCMILDVVQKEGFYFESHGLELSVQDCYLGTVKVYEYLQEHFQTTILPQTSTWTWHAIAENPHYNNYKQKSLQPLGATTCQSWTFFYRVMKCLNPDVAENILYENMAGSEDDPQYKLKLFLKWLYTYKFTYRNRRDEKFNSLENLKSSLIIDKDCTDKSCFLNEKHKNTIESLLV
jgi:hypothetical protein